ncbi:MAG: hypothetical protein ACLU6Y_09385 [Ruminococcus sp.]
MIIGGPPCQAYSLVGRAQSSQGLRQWKKTHVTNYIRCIRDSSQNISPGCLYLKCCGTTYCTWWRCNCTETIQRPNAIKRSEEKRFVPSQRGKHRMFIFHNKNSHIYSIWTIQSMILWQNIGEILTFD